MSVFEWSLTGSSVASISFFTLVWHWSLQFMQIFLQANLDMSNLLILKTLPVSKWCSIPKHYPLCVIVFKPCLCRTRLSRKLCYIEVIFLSVTKFSISFTTACVEVKSCIRKEWTKTGHSGRHSRTRHFFLLVHMGKNVIPSKWQRILLLTNQTIVNSLWIWETSLFAYLELRIPCSVFSISLEFEMSRLACIFKYAFEEKTKKGGGGKQN